MQPQGLLQRHHYSVPRPCSAASAPPLPSAPPAASAPLPWSSAATPVCRISALRSLGKGPRGAGIPAAATSLLRTAK
eukprot:5959672-Alexandrium_andersonii.AAC.1